MRRESTLGLLDMVREHNSLNGLRFVVLEFLLVIAAALLIFLSGIVHGRILLSLAGIGIVANALAVIIIAVAQILHRDKDEGLLKMHSPQYRATLSRERPHLVSHTTTVTLSVLIPFLLVALLLVTPVSTARDKGATAWRKLRNR
jgi:hypothetical protein